MVDETQASTATLQLENSILFQNVVKRSLLMPVQPTGEGRKLDIGLNLRFSPGVRSP